MVMYEYSTMEILGPNGPVSPADHVFDRSTPGPRELITGLTIITPCTQWRRQRGNKGNVPSPRNPENLQRMGNSPRLSQQ